MDIPMDNSIYLWPRTDTNIGIRTCKPEHKKRTGGQLSLTKDFHMYVIMNPFNASIPKKNT
jgi:hypothetical protein